jgi:glutamate dehydrogenase/leucine dehydrogenase
MINYHGFGMWVDGQPSLISEAGGKVIAVSDAIGAIKNKDGIDVSKLFEQCKKIVASMNLMR